VKLSRTHFHAARIADAILFWPLLAFVIWGELSAPPNLPLIVHFNDKVQHFTAYFILSAMAAGAVKRRGTALWACASLILLGGVLEIVQGFTGRDMSIYDELANSLGAIVGTISARAVIEPLRRRLNAW
jgi:VanZ family protein